MECSDRDFHRKLALAWKGTRKLRPQGGAWVSLPRAMGRILQAVNNSMCKGPETGESWTSLGFCREARVTAAEQTGDWKEG